MLSDWKETIVCPQVKWVFMQERSVWDRMLIRHTSEEELPVYEVQAEIHAVSWSARLEFGYLFDPERMSWRLAGHEDWPGPKAFGLLTASRGGVWSWKARVPESDLGASLGKTNDRDARRAVKALVESQHPGVTF